MEKYYQKRWQQRFQNFDRAFLLLEEAINISTPSVVERAGMIQFFEMSFELGWKVLKDYLEDGGYIVKSPREAIKLAFQQNIVLNAEQWLQALGDRNLTAHIYNETQAEQIEAHIRCDYYPLLSALKETLINDFMIKKQANEERTGLSGETLQQIKNVLNQFTEVEKACIFGSRAKGNFKLGSDIDIALFGEEITPKILQKIAYQLNEETTMPYFFDLVHYESITSDTLLAHINEFGLCL